MATVWTANQRGKTVLPWLESRHSFSFADYHDPARMGVGHLRVINEDWIRAGSGFPTHPHRDMEIITYVIDGALQHRDSMGNGSIIAAGDVQVMTAGSGITHSEFNPSSDTDTHLLQIWILPKVRGAEPRYDQRSFDPAGRHGQLTLLASGTGRDDSLRIGQSVDLFGGVLADGQNADLPVAAGHDGYLHVVAGEAQVGPDLLSTGDAVPLLAEGDHNVVARGELEFLWFDMS